MTFTSENNPGFKKGEPNPGGAASREKVKIKNRELVREVMTKYPGVTIPFIAQYLYLTDKTVAQHAKVIRNESYQEIKAELDSRKV